MKKVLVICDDIWHPGEVIEWGLAALPTSEYDFTYMYTAKDLLLPEDLRKYDVVMITKTNAVRGYNQSPWFEDSVTETGPDEFRAFVEAGGNLLFVHSGACYFPALMGDVPERFQDPHKRMLNLVGCEFHGHPLRCPVKLIPTSDHPIMKGVEAFEERDEHYQVEFTDDNYIPLCRTESAEGKPQTGAYIRPIGKGNIVTLFPGHTLALWKHPQFQKMLLNTLHWISSQNAAAGIGSKSSAASALSQVSGKIQSQNPTAFITGADRGVGFSLCKEALEHGYRVFAGRFLDYWKELDELKAKWADRLVIVPLDVSDPQSIRTAARLTAEETDHIDILCNVAGIFGMDSPEFNKKRFDTNSIGPICMTESFLPLLQKGMGRLCYLSSEAGSISLGHRVGDNLFSYGYSMSKSALNMAVKLMFNELRPLGYTFRLYHPGWVRSYMAGDTLATQGMYSADESARAAWNYFTVESDSEDVLMMVDIEGQSWSF